ncbi:alpha/beta hydrolase [uncultured Photobacterium sp.]|uniref:alpha/beta fold hydrolase n=1 Tax=uncultured Photobacterium sp. TaxID=173973 RepID=UPI002634550D|nr:alpha/beta hydrolase [uncultured Photobacterium sp.]
MTTGCEVVHWKTKHDQSSLEKEGFSKYKMVLKEGGELTYWEGGQGQPLLLLHGFGGTAAATWKAEMLQLSKKYRVIAPDLLWFGESYSDNAAQLSTQTNAIWQLVDKLQLQKIDVAGISYGGFITYDMMLTPERINKAVIIASPGPLFSDGDLDDLVKRAGIDSPEELFVPNSGDDVKRLYDNVFIEKKRIPDFIANQIYLDYFSQWKPQRTQLIKTLPNDRDRIQQYDPKKSPQTLIIWGQNDKIFPLNSGIKLSKYIQAPIIVLPKTGHGITNEHPKITADLIDYFLSSL